MRTITDADLAALRSIGEFAVSPDGARVVFVLTSTDYEGDRYRANLWLVDAAGGEPRQLTAARSRDAAPRWSPDGTRLAFTSDRDGGKRELWVIPVGGGEASPVRRPDGSRLHEDGDITEPCWSPDGSRLAYLAKAARPESDDPSDDPTHAPAEGSDVRVYSQLGYKLDGSGFWDGRYRHLFAVTAGGGEPAQLTDGPWDDAQPAWSPDGSRLAFVSRRTPDREYTAVSDLFTVPAGGGAATQVTGSVGPVSHPQWSPDGAMLAYIGHDTPAETGPATHDWLWTVAADGGTPACLTRDYDRDVGGGVIGDFAQGGLTPPVQWSPDGLGLLFLAGDCGTTALMQVARTQRHVETAVDGDRNILGFHGAENTLAILVSTPTLPCDLFVIYPEGGWPKGDFTSAEVGDMTLRERRLTDINADALADVRLSKPERVSVPVDAGVMMDGWLLHPPDFDPARRYPLILDIHGGPRGQYGSTFTHAFQRYAAEGYVVAYFNPRGSTGYGQAFTSRLTGDWGGVDAGDVLAGLDLVLERRPYLSESRVGVTGGSYGGYLTNWLIGAHPDRWRVAVTERSTVSRLSSYGTSDMIWRSLEWEFGGPWWERRDFYWERSPIAHLHKITTPLLIIHSENDHRCTVSEAEQLFTALRRLGRDVVFVRFPDESHGLSRTGKPKHRRERLERIVGWFKKYLPPGE